LQETSLKDWIGANEEQKLWMWIVEKSKGKSKQIENDETALMG